MFRKINLYYRGKNGKVMYISSTKSFKYIKDAVDSIKTYPNYPQTYCALLKQVKEDIGEEFEFSRVFGKKEKELLT